MADRPGAQIELISVCEIRYVGTLEQVNREDNTVTLTKVSVFGTEDRATGENAVPGTDGIFDVIVFRGADIKKLVVYDNVVDSAIVYKTPSARPNSSRGRDHQPNNQFSHQNRGGYNRGGRGGSVYDNNYNNRSERGRRGGGGGRFYNGGRNRREEHTGKEFIVAMRSGSGGPKEKYQDDFDFSRGKEEFEKTKKELGEKADEDKKAYNKSSFFDNISCGQRENRLGRDEMKKADAETFGAEMVGSMRNFRRRGRYRR